MEVSWLPRELWLCALGDSGTNVTAGEAIECKLR
jgi:hypothetical protein